ncbi:MAG: hypothetical protein ACOYL5_16515 [Phototrophicaceae bacterium]
MKQLDWSKKIYNLLPYLGVITALILLSAMHIYSRQHPPTMKHKPYPAAMVNEQGEKMIMRDDCIVSAIALSVAYCTDGRIISTNIIFDWLDDPAFAIWLRRFIAVFMAIGFTNGLIAFIHYIWQSLKHRGITL